MINITLLITAVVFCFFTPVYTSVIYVQNMKLHKSRYAVCAQNVSQSKDPAACVLASVVPRALTMKTTWEVERGVQTQRTESTGLRLMLAGRQNSPESLLRDETHLTSKTRTQEQGHEFTWSSIPEFNMLPVCCFCCRSDYVTSYFLAFSNDSREWTTIHDGYADWVSSPKIISLPWTTSTMSPLPFPRTHFPLTCSLLSSCSLETVIKTFRWWTSWQSLCWPATSGSSLRAGTALCAWGWRS